MKMQFSLMCCLTAAWPLFAQIEGIQTSDMLSGWVQGSGQHMAALKLVLQPDWKTYWRAPGSGGIPPLFDWTGSENLADVRIIWPRPMVFDAGGVTSVGYHDAMILPLSVTAMDPSKPVVLNGSVTLGICKDICIPVTLDLQTDLPDVSTPDPMILAALADHPISADLAGVTQVQCSAQPIRDGLRVTAQVQMPHLDSADYMVLEHDDARIWISDAEISQSGDQITAVVDMVPPMGKPFDLDGDALMLTVLGSKRAVELRGCPLTQSGLDLQ
jgi:DsbC/DsbD-like thiol-disulfide interchange protein